MSSFKKITSSRSEAELRHNVADVLVRDPKSHGKVKQKVRKVKRFSTGKISRELDQAGPKIDQCRRSGDEIGRLRIINQLRP